MIDGDTLVLITPIQASKINVVFLENEHLLSVTSDYERIISIHQKRDSVCELRVANMRKQISSIEGVNKEFENVNNVLQNEVEARGSQISRLQKLNKILSSSGLAVGVGVGILISRLFGN